MNNDIIIAAAFAATPRHGNEPETDWIDRVAVTAQTIAINTDSEHSPIVKAIQAAADATVFRGTIMDVRQDERAPRLQVIVYSPHNADTGKAGDIYGQPLPPGYEMLRTPASFEKARYEHVGKTALSLIGHEVLLWKTVETFDQGGQTRKSRVLTHIKDLGINPNVRVHTRTNKHGVEIPVRAELLTAAS